MATMGNEEQKVPLTADLLHADIWGQNITLGTPLLGMHRGEELTSVISNFQAAKAVEAFFSVEDHSLYMPVSK